jgi:NAD(P)H dehydrogenase (quinone)
MYFAVGLYTTASLTWTIRIAETLPDEVLAKMHAPSKPGYPVITPSELPEFDAFIFGIPTRYGNFPAQWKVCF